jgi:hypothetical protein
MTFVASSQPKNRSKPESDAEHRSDVVLAKLFELAKESDCFDSLDVLLDGDFQDLRPDFHKWACLLELDEVQGWLLREGSWCEEAFRNNFPDGIRFVQAILWRRLTHLETRADPRKLIELWSWATEQPGIRVGIRSIWEGKQDLLRDTLVLSDPLTIPEQEERFATLLRTTADELEADVVACDKLRWAIDTLRDLARERCPEVRPVRRAFARIVFAWEDQEPASCRRPGVLIPFEFRRKSMGWGADKVDWFTPRQWFDPDFIEAMGSLMEVQGDCYPMSVVRDRLPELPPGKLCGTSGKLAVAIAQKLANHSGREGVPCAMPPWVVVTATARTGIDGMATSVDLLRQKMLVLRQEGVRVAVVADTQHEINPIRAEFGDIHIITLGGACEEGSELLRTNRYAWDADLKSLRPRLTRRHLAAAAIFSAVIGSFGLYFGKYLPHIHNVPTTRAMEISWDRRPELEELWKRCKAFAVNFDQIGPENSKNPNVTRLQFLCRGVYPRDGQPDSRIIGVLAPGDRPPAADHSAVGVETIAKHTAFDYSEWEEVRDERQIQENPIEVCYATSVYHFERKKEGELRIALELNSSGFGVVPLLQPGDELILGTKPMDEAGRITKTTYVIRTIPASWPRKFEVAINSLYLNGTQDQHVRHKTSEWSAIRLSPGTREASLSLVKPKRRTILSIRKSERIEKNDEIDLGVPATFSRAAGEKLPKQDWYVWPIDTDELTRSTVYSMRWKLDAAR